MKNKTIIVYNSKTGFTERYARWINGELLGEMVSYNDRNIIDYDKYDVIIFGGWFHAGKINGLKWLKDKISKLEGKKIVVYATGATPSYSPEVETAMKQNFTDKEWNQVKTFYLQSGLCYEKMGIGDKIMMALFRKMLKMKDGDSEMYKMISHSYDCSDKKRVIPLVKYIKELKCD